MADHQTRAGRRADPQLKTPSPVAGVTYFLGIGIDEYQHWPRLKNAVKDVQAIATLLVDEYGLEAGHTRLLLNEQATEANIVETFESLTREVQSEDSVLIYYAGHGHLNERGRGFWVPAEAPRGEVVRYIRNSTIKDYIGDIPSLHTLLISDSCFSGSLFSSGATRSTDLAAEELARLPSRWAICSGRHDEVVADGPTDGHSPFADSILEVLGRNERPVITTGFLVQQVIEQTRANYDQLPDGGPLQGVGHKRGQFVFRQQTGKGAHRLWERIKTAMEETLPELVAKKDLLRQYCQQYPKGAHYSDALTLGRRLEHKRQFLDVYDSEFGLLALLEHNTPYAEEISTRLAQLRRQERVQPAYEQRSRQIGFSQPAAITTTPPRKKGRSETKHTVLDGALSQRFFKYAAALILTALVIPILMTTNMGVPIMTMAIYMLVLPGYLIWRYHQSASSWRNTWILFFVTIGAFLASRMWLGLYLLASINYLLMYLVIGALPLVPVLLTAVLKGQSIQFLGEVGRTAPPQVVKTSPEASDTAQEADVKQLSYWKYALACIFATGVPAAILIEHKTNNLDFLPSMILFAVMGLGPPFLIWHYGVRSLSRWKSMLLGAISVATFLVVGMSIEGDLHESELLVYLFIGCLMVVPAWIGIWLKKRKIRRQSRP